MSKQLHSFDGMNLVKAEYATSGLTDTAFAALATEKLGRKYSHAHIRQYRQVLGIQNNTARVTPKMVWIVIDSRAPFDEHVSAVFSKEEDAKAAAAEDECLSYVGRNVQ